jgi:hypothetical protein
VSSPPCGLQLLVVHAEHPAMCSYSRHEARVSQAAAIQQPHSTARDRQVMAGNCSSTHCSGELPLPSLNEARLTAAAVTDSARP